MNICQKNHKDIGRDVRIKEDFFSIYPHSKFKRGQILRVSGDLRFVRFEGRKTPIWMNELLLEREPVRKVAELTG